MIYIVMTWIAIMIVANVNPTIEIKHYGEDNQHYLLTYKNGMVVMVSKINTEIKWKSKNEFTITQGDKVEKYEITL